MGAADHSQEEKKGNEIRKNWSRVRPLVPFPSSGMCALWTTRYVFSPCHPRGGPLWTPLHLLYLQYSPRRPGCASLIHPQSFITPKPNTVTLLYSTRSRAVLSLFTLFYHLVSNLTPALCAQTNPVSSVDPFETPLVASCF
jgi:hypothetical protein